MYLGHLNDTLSLCYTPTIVFIFFHIVFFFPGWSNNITLDGSESFDPDWPGDFTGQYKWYCHLTNETLPPDIDDIEDSDDLPAVGRWFC